MSEEQNQCDGCMSGQELRGSLHIDAEGKALMVCQKSKYSAPGTTVHSHSVRTLPNGDTEGFAFVTSKMIGGER
jgi:hypothetical protein